MARTLSILLALLIVAACQRGAARECDEFFPSCPVGQICDYATNQCIESECGSCAAPTPVCEPDTDRCVECVGVGPQDDCPNRRLCDKNVCKQCTEDSECPDGLCLRNGGCPAASAIAFATADGTSNTTCSLSQPCTLAAALATGREYVRVRGNHALTGPLVLTRTVRIYGPLDGTRPRLTGAGPIFDISGNVTVELRNLELFGSTAEGVLVRSGAPTVDLETVDIIGSAGLGISAGNAALKVSYAIIASNAGGGINAAGTVQLESSIVAQNGSASATTGGLRLLSSGTGSTIRFNTFAQNQAAGIGSGVACAAAQPLSSNIFAGNTMTGCTAIYSLFPTGTNVPGTGNKAGDPMFLGTTLPANRDDETYFHVATTSPAVASGEPVPLGTVVSDIDGDSRTTELEIGADELR